MSRTVLISVDIANLHAYQAPISTMIEYVRPDDQLVLMTVVENVSSGYISSFLPKDIGAAAEAAAKEDLRDFSAKHFPNHTEKKHVVGNGNVYESVIEVGAKAEADLIMAIERRVKHNEVPVFGPNAARIARHAHCSVLIIR